MFSRYENVATSIKNCSTGIKNCSTGIKGADRSTKKQRGILFEQFFRALIIFTGNGETRLDLNVE